MKRLLLSLLYIIAAMSISGLTRSKMIERDLSGLGISKEIIYRTIELDREITNVVSENNAQKTGKVTLKIEELLRQDERNFILSEKLINIYNALEKSDSEKKKNLEIYKKYNKHEPSRLFHENLYYLNKGDGEAFLNNFEKLKKKYPEHLITAIALTYKIGWETIWNIMDNEENTALALLLSIMSMCDDKVKADESRISDEEAWAYKLTLGWFAMSYYLEEDRVEDAIDFYTKHFGGKNQPESGVLEYNKAQHQYILGELQAANKKHFSGNRKVYDENIKKIGIGK